MIAVWIIPGFSCQENTGPVAPTSVWISPDYTKINLAAQQDTIHFVLGQNTFNEIKSFNFFFDHARSFISFYDRRSESINIYDFNTRQLVKNVSLKKVFNKKKLFKGSVYVQNFDSILVTHYTDLYLIDSAGAIKKIVPFIPEKESFAFYETPRPVVVKNNIVYMGVRAYVSETSLKEIKNWKVLYGFNLNDNTKKLNYLLPPAYSKGLYGSRFMECSYCYNNNGDFVFSFPADTNIYETNLSDHHVAYYAKSKYQKEPIEPVSKEVLEKDEGRKEYTLRDCYGPIYFDPYKKRYLRFVKQKVSRELYESKNYDRKISVIVLNESFRIIGEFDFKKDYSYDAIFFTPDGGIYARVNERDESALHFVRLAWKDEANDQLPLTKK